MDPVDGGYTIQYTSVRPENEIDNDADNSTDFIYDEGEFDFPDDVDYAEANEIYESVSAYRKKSEQKIERNVYGIPAKQSTASIKPRMSSDQLPVAKERSVPQKKSVHRHSTLRKQVSSTPTEVEMLPLRGIGSLNRGLSILTRTDPVEEEAEMPRAASTPTKQSDADPDIGVAEWKSNHNLEVTAVRSVDFETETTQIQARHGGLGRYCRRLLAPLAVLFVVGALGLAGFTFLKVNALSTDVEKLKSVPSDRKATNEDGQLNVSTTALPGKHNYLLHVPSPSFLAAVTTLLCKRHWCFEEATSKALSLVKILWLITKNFCPAAPNKGNLRWKKRKPSTSSSVRVMQNIYRICLARNIWAPPGLSRANPNH